MGTISLYSNDGNTLIAQTDSGDSLESTAYLRIYKSGDDIYWGVSSSASTNPSSGTKIDAIFTGINTSSNQTTASVNSAFGTQSFESQPNGFVVRPVNGSSASTSSTYYLVGEVVQTDYRPLTYVDAKIQVDSAIRDANGVRIDTNYQRKPQVIEYTVPSSVTTGTKTLAEYNGTYDGSPGRVKFVIEVTSSSYKGIYTIEASWGQANGNVTLVSGSGESSDVSVIYVYCPSSSSYYASSPPFLAVQNNSNRDKHVKITILEDSGNLTWKDNWNTTAPTTHYNSIGFAQLNYTAYVKFARSSESASTSTYSNQSYATMAGRFRTGESDAYKIMAVDHTGVAYKINTSGKKFPLPISMYVGRNTSANQTTYSTYVQSGGYSASYTYVTYLSSSSYNNFTLPTLTASDGGKTLYVRGSLDADGYFVCDGHVTLSMEAGYTYIPFGTLNPDYSGSTASVPTTYSFNAISVQAYTLDANGKLTHIDGKPVGGGVSLEAIYPVGSIYMNASNSTNPATLLGFGTWTALAPGRVLMGAGTDSVITDAPTYTAGDTVGEYSHTLSTTEMPSHGHSVSVDSTSTAHTHSGTSDGGGVDHTHSGTTNEEGWNHYHGIGQDGKDYFFKGIYNPNNSGYDGAQNVWIRWAQGIQGSKWDGTDSNLAVSWSDYHSHGGATGTASANHTHSFTTGGASAYSHTHTFTTGAMSANGTHGHTVNQSNAGGGGAHNNIQPSLVVYMWVRTA